MFPCIFLVDRLKLNEDKLRNGWDALYSLVNVYWDYLFLCKDFAWYFTLHVLFSLISSDQIYFLLLVVQKNLEVGEVLCVDMSSIAAVSATVNVQVKYNGPMRRVVFGVCYSFFFSLNICMPLFSHCCFFSFAGSFLFAIGRFGPSVSKVAKHMLNFARLWHFKCFSNWKC